MASRIPSSARTAEPFIGDSERTLHRAHRQRRKCASRRAWSDVGCTPFPLPKVKRCGASPDSILVGNNKKPRVQRGFLETLDARFQR
jgi:hypothetical protein